MRTANLRILQAMVALTLMCGCDEGGPQPSLPPVSPPAPDIPRGSQNTEGTSNAEAAGTGTQLPDAGTKGTNGVADPERPNPVAPPP